MLDSGCTTVGVRKSMVAPEQFTGEIKHCKQFAGDIVKLPIARVHLKTPQFSGEVEAYVINDPVADVILGNIPGLSLNETQTTAAVQTRAQKQNENKPFRPLLTAKAPKLNITHTDVCRLQKDDDSLKQLFEKEARGWVDDGKKHQILFVFHDDLLSRKLVSKADNKVTFQLIVPKTLRQSVFIAAHDGLFGGHMGACGTFKRISPFFFWPGLRADVKEYCRACDICQRMYPKGRTPMASQQSMPIIETPLQRVGIDLIGPIAPVSGRRFWHAPTCVDFAT